MSTQRLINTFIDYVSVGSESGNEREFCEALEKDLIDIGFQVERSEMGHLCQSNGFNIHGYLPGEGESILFCCHMDTVKPGCGIKPIEENGIIRSEGDTILGADDKSGIAEITEAVRRLIESNTPHRPIEIMFTLCEEVGLLGSKFADYSNVKSKNALVLDGEEIGEIVNTAAANIVMSFHFFGKAAHAGICPENGIHALKAAARAVDNIPVGHVDDISVMNVSNFLSPGATNIVAPRADFNMEFRSYDEGRVQQHIKTAIEAIEEACNHYGATYTCESERHSEAFSVDPDSQFIKDIFSAYERIGVTPYLEKTLGGCDASNLATHGINAVNIGTGMRDVHTTSEYIKVDDMEKSVCFLYELLKI